MVNDHNNWTHAICALCWNKQNPDKPIKTELYTSGEQDTCCFCGEATRSGIYVRGDPTTVHTDPT